MPGDPSVIRPQSMNWRVLMSVRGVRVPVAVVGFVLSAVACTSDSTVAPRDEEDPRDMLTPMVISARRG